MARSRLAERLRASRIIARRELRFSMFSIGPYLAMFVALVLSYLLLRNYTSSINTNGVLVLANPLNTPFYVCVVVSSIFVALSSAISIARDKETGNLEVLFYGPVDGPSYLMGRFTEQLGTYAMMLVFYVLFFLLASSLTNFAFTLGFAKVVILSAFVVSSMVAFGTLISTLTSKVRNAVLLFLGLVLLFLGLQFLGSTLANVQPDNLSTVAAYTRAFVSAILKVVQWFSPFAYLTRGIDAVEQGSTINYLTTVAASLAYSVVVLLGAMFLFDRKGVRRG